MSVQTTTATLITKTSRLTLTEDWTVVVLSFLIIGLSLAGLQIAAPSFNWKDSDELTGKIFAGANLRAIGAQFLLVYGVALLGTVLTSRPVRAVLLGFPVVFALTVLALLIAGNTTVKSLNLEAVIFSLIIGLLVGNLFQLPQWLRRHLIPLLSY